MDGFVAVCRAADVPQGEARGFTVGGQQVAVYNVDGVFYATDDRCTHGLATLSDGMLDGDLIECPLHFGAFNVRTGAAAAPPCSIAIRTHAVQEQDGQVFIEEPK